MLIQAWGYAIFFVLLTSFSVLGYSRLLSERFGKSFAELPVVFSLGLFTTALFVFGLANSFRPWVVLPFIFLGLLFFRFDLLSLKLSRLNKVDAIWLFFPTLFFLTRFFSAGLPQQHNDALYYHLAAAKFWVQTGAITVPAIHPSFAQATLWETLYSVPMFFLGTEGVFSHVVTQIYGQWMHMLWGHLGCILLASMLLKRFIDKENQRLSFILFLSWMIVSLPAVEWTGGLAKNDFIVALFVFSAIYAALQQNARLTGVFAGFAFASKMSALGSLVALPILFLGSAYSWCEVLRYAVFGVLATLPVLIRNMLSTGAPLFPMFDGKFGAEPLLAQWWVMHNASFAGMPKFSVEMFSWVWVKLLEKTLPKVLFFFALGGFFMRRQKNTKLLLFSLTQLALILSTLRAGADGRYAAYALSFFFVVCFGELFKYPVQKTAAKFLPVFALLGLTLNSPVDLFFKVPAGYWFYDASKYVNQYHAYQNMKNWINANTAQDAVLVAIADKANFYLDHHYETFTEMKKWEDLTNASFDANDFLGRVKGAGYRYVMLQTHFVYPPSLARFWDDLMSRARAKTVFEADSLILVDLGK